MKQYIVLLLLSGFLKLNAQTLQDCSSCSSTIIKSEQIKDLSLDEIRLLSNEIFARNGYKFENSRFQNYFENKSWYKSKGDNKSIVFKDIEKQNIKILQEQTKLLKTEQEEMINQIKTFKSLVLANKTDELKSKFGFTYEKQYGAANAELLKKVFSKINLDDINYYKDKGLNSVLIDNGFVNMYMKSLYRKKK